MSDSSEIISEDDIPNYLNENFPVNLCEYIIENNYYELHVCFASFIAQEVGDLSITKGDIIIANNQVNEHWLQGQVCYDSQSNTWPHLIVSQQVGSFPRNHCCVIDANRTKTFSQEKINLNRNQHKQFETCIIPPNPSFKTATTHSSSLSSGTSSLHSTDFQNHQPPSKPPPPRPEQLPRQLSNQTNEQPHKPALLSLKQQDKLKGWLHTVKKKTARLSTRITASLGLITLTRDEEFERHYESFKNIEKTIRMFIKNLTTFVEHFENFLVSLQQTSENLSDFYRDKSHHKELEELRKKNKALNCDHFHSFKRTVERQVVAVLNQLLQKFSGPHQLIGRRSTKLIDYDTKSKEVESCRDLQKRATLSDQYVIAKNVYEKINKQLIDELPMFNNMALDIFKECILVILEARRNLVLSYTKQTANLLNTPLMLTYTASDVASSIFMSCELTKGYLGRQGADIKELLEQDRKDSAQTSGHDTRHNSANDEDPFRPDSVASQLSSEFEQLGIAPREISSTPLSHVSGTRDPEVGENFDEPDGKRSPERIIKSVNSNNLCSNGVSTNSADEGTQPNTPVKKEYQPKDKRRKRKTPIYIASWPFVATGPNQLTIVCKQPLKLIKGCDECGNSDWSLVQDKKGQLGYVPSSYIKKKE